MASGDSRLGISRGNASGDVEYFERSPRSTQELKIGYQVRVQCSDGQLYSARITNLREADQRLKIRFNREEREPSPTRRWTEVKCVSLRGVKLPGKDDIQGIPDCKRCGRGGILTFGLEGPEWMCDPCDLEEIGEASERGHPPAPDHRPRPASLPMETVWGGALRGMDDGSHGGQGSWICDECDVALLQEAAAILQAPPPVSTDLSGTQRQPGPTADVFVQQLSNEWERTLRQEFAVGAPRYSAIEDSDLVWQALDSRTLDKADELVLGWFLRSDVTHGVLRIPEATGLQWHGVQLALRRLLDLGLIFRTREHENHAP